MTDKTNETNENDFPGYPYYPPQEDIMNSKDNKRVEIDVENLSRSGAAQPVTDSAGSQSQAVGHDSVVSDEDTDKEKPFVNDADLTEEDLIALGDKNTEYGDIAMLSGDDLDIPGAEEDDASEQIGAEDEENNYYSLGGDAHEDLEEDKA